MPDDLDQIATATSEDEQIAGMGICVATHMHSYVSGADMWRSRPVARNSALTMGFAAT
jgi:hypothetical protein